MELQVGLREVEGISLLDLRGHLTIGASESALRSAVADCVSAKRLWIVLNLTEISAIEDPVVSLALSMIREHACNGLRVREVAERVPVSGTVLQRRFRAVVGRSVHEEIVRVQLRKAQELLRETDLALRVVAEKAGFKHQEYMGAVFKSRLGVTPGQYRRKYQPMAGAAVDSAETT